MAKSELEILQAKLDKEVLARENAEVATGKEKEKAEAAEGKIEAAKTAAGKAEEKATAAEEKAESLSVKNGELEELAEKNPARDLVVKGSYKSKKHKKSVKFKDGYKGTRDLNGAVVNSEDLLAAANDSDYESDENDLTHEGSVEIMDRLIKMEYAGLEKA